MAYTPNKLAYTSPEGINSSTTISGSLWVGNIFTGAGEQNDYTYVGVNLQTDEAGTLTFEFSQDGTNWSKYPVTEFEVASGINEVHGAWKGTRWVRPRFTGVDGSRTYFRIRTMYSDVPITLTAPLNQSINSDQDANVVRAVGIGQDPQGSYVNQRVDGDAIETSTPLSGSEVWTSSLIDVTGYSQIETRLFADQSGTLVGRWYSDPNKTQLIRTFTRPYNDSEVGSSSYFSAPLFGDYLEYEYTNGLTPQTGFNLELYLRTKSISGQILGVNDFIPSGVVANLGRNIITGQDNSGNFRNASTDEHGDIKVHIHEPTTAFGELSTAIQNPVIQISFPYNINTDIVTPITSSTNATITQSEQMAVISTGTVANTSASLYSNRTAKYRTGQGIEARFTALFTTGSTDGLQLAGIGSLDASNKPIDGFFFAMTGSNFGTMRYQNGISTFVSQSSWSTDTFDGSSNLNNPTGQLHKPDKGNVYSIKFQWLGYGAIKYMIEDSKEGFYSEAHLDEYANNNTIPSTFNPTFPICYYADNGTTPENVTLKLASAAAFIQGENKITGPLNSIDNSIAATTGQDLVLALTNQSVFPSGSINVNKVEAKLRDLSILNDGANNTLVRIKIIENPTLTGGTETYLNPNTSVITSNTTATYTPNSGKVIGTYGITEVNSLTVDLLDKDITLPPGKTIAFVALGDASSETNVGISWVEDF